MNSHWTKLIRGAIPTLLLCGCVTLRQQNNTISDSTRIRELTEKWFQAWNSVSDSKSMQELSKFYFREDDQLIIFDGQSSTSSEIKGWQNYRNLYEPRMKRYKSWFIQPVDRISIDVSNNLAVVTFTYQGMGILKEDKKVITWQHVTHVWKRDALGWYIVHEHISGSSAKKVLID